MACIDIGKNGTGLKGLQLFQDEYGSVPKELEIPHIHPDAEEKLAEYFSSQEGIDQILGHMDQAIPILFMTVRDDFASKQKGYRIGIDDYMAKPIDLDELFLRIGALQRRAKIANSHRLEIGKLIMDERTAVYDGENIAMTTREFNIHEYSIRKHFHRNNVGLL